MNLEKIFSQINSYIGFSIKSKQAIIGIENILLRSNKTKLILISKDLSTNSKKKLIQSSKIKCKIIEYDFSKLTIMSNCKVIGITNDNLARAIIMQHKNVEEIE